MSDLPSGEQSVVDEIENEITIEDQLIDAVYKFNIKPADGIPLLCSVKGVECTPKEIAHILHTVPGLLGSKIGDYLSKKQNHAILSYYFNELDLRRPFVDALRLALNSSMTLPGEGGLIDHVVETFSEIYTAQNPGSFPSVFCAHTIAFSLIMLNVDLHSPNVPKSFKRMTVSEYIANTRDAVPVTDVSDATLTQLYNEIKANEIKARDSSPDQLMPFVAPKLRGKLKKKSEHFNSFWTNHFFILAESALHYYHDPNCDVSTPPNGIIYLEDLSIIRDQSKPTFFVLEKTKGEIKYVKFPSNGPSYVKHGVHRILFEAPTAKSAIKWYIRIQQSIHASRFSPAQGPFSGLSPGIMGTEVSETGQTSEIDFD